MGIRCIWDLKWLQRKQCFIDGCSRHHDDLTPFTVLMCQVAVDSPLMRSLKVARSLEEALATCCTSIALTRRAGGARVVYPSLRSLEQQCSEVVNSFCDASPCPQDTRTSFDEHEVPLAAALVFGREESGLTDEEIMQCSYAAAIPSCATFPSLNLSHAVAVTLSWLFEFHQVEDKFQMGKHCIEVLMYTLEACYLDPPRTG